MAMTEQRTVDATYFEPQLGPVLRPKQAAEYLGLAEQTLAHRRVQGLAPRFVRLTRKSVGYLKSDLDEFLTAAICQSTSDRPMAAA